ncbi:hypothetical protein MOBT1_001098 [Malassezia obtusa]|uniref:Uncharacterized protein n=1 Tax=Malassezia obtusa TaxID=76774 RepID=A0AAF0DYA6_9BASI|nr:hypothetical protein MOBT1_001098 [Malassezia obtusa]
MERRAVRRYALLLARSSAARAPRAPASVPPCWTWWDTWAPDERARFFHALGVYSRHRPDLIADAVRTRSVEEVCLVLRRFRREVSSAWLDVEEQCAAALAQREDVVAWGEKGDAAVLVAEFLRHDPPSRLCDLVARLVHVQDTLPPVLEPTDAYRAFSHAGPAPALRSLEDVAALVDTMLTRGLVQCGADVSRPLSPDALHSPLPLTWPDTQDTALIDSHAISRFLQRYAHAGATPYLASGLCEALARVVEAFVTHVLYELITVGERSLRAGQVDAQHVWTTVARLGYSLPGVDLDPHLLTAIGVLRACADPPVAWSSAAPTEARGRIVPLDPTLSDSDTDAAADEASDAGAEDPATERDVPGRSSAETSAAHAALRESPPREETPSEADSAADTHSSDETRASSPASAPSTIPPPCPRPMGEAWRIGALAPLVPHD